HPGLVAGSVLEGNATSRELLDAFVEVVALEIDGCGREDLLFGVDLHREGHAARGFEAGVSILGAVDDLLESEPTIEIHRALVIGPGDGDLVEANARSDVHPHPALTERSGALPQTR